MLNNWPRTKAHPFMSARCWAQRCEPALPNSNQSIRQDHIGNVGRLQAGIHEHVGNIIRIQGKAKGMSVYIST